MELSGYIDGDNFIVTITSNGSTDTSWYHYSDDEIAHAFTRYSFDKAGNYNILNNEKYTVKQYKELHPSYCEDLID